MGGVVAKGENNDELVDNLVEAKYIEKKEIENVFRSVDRGDFYPGEYLIDSYKDAAMRRNNIHMSAPSIYSQVMENFDLKPGLSFLNIGFGTGYFSTMMGLSLGPNGINHGIDIYDDVFDYARDHIESFIKYSEGFDSIKFCKPELFLANINRVDVDFGKYDRVYCGACIPNEEICDRIKKLVKPDGGIMIYPLGGCLMKYNSSEAEETNLLSVQFSELIDNQIDDYKEIRIYRQPKSLLHLCRQTILAVITKEKFHMMDSLPIPNVLIKYLKYYRDPSRPKPVRENKVPPDNEQVTFRLIATIELSP